MREKILIFGGSGLVGSRFIELLGDQFEIIAPSHQEVDLTDRDGLLKNIDRSSPTQILVASAYTNVDKAEEESELANLLNSKVPKMIAIRAKELGIPVYYLSTDYVFDGNSEIPYKEEDKPNLLGTYAKSKRDGEWNVLSESESNGVIRLIMPFRSHFDKKLDIARLVVQKLKNGETLQGIIDQNINPVFVDDLILALGAILRKKSSGIYHVGAASFTTPFEFMKKIAQTFDLDESLIGQTTFEEFSRTRTAPRPQHSGLDVSKFRSEFGEGILHTIDESLVLFKRQLNS